MSQESYLNQYFTPEVRKLADAIVARYETRRAPMLEILHLIQEKFGYISREAELAVAEYLNLPAVDVHEVLTFYTLYYRKPKAKVRFNICRTLSCSLRGAHDMVKHLEKKLGIKNGESTDDGQFSIHTVECLGACELAPMMQLNDDEFVGCLTREKLDDVIARAPEAANETVAGR